MNVSTVVLCDARCHLHAIHSAHLACAASSVDIWVSLLTLKMGTMWSPPVISWLTKAPEKRVRYLRTINHSEIGV